MSETHFSMEAGGTPTGPGRFVTVNDMDAVEFLPGLEFRPVLGDNVMTNFVTFAPHTEAPLHVHEEEQVVIVLEGELEFVIDGETKLLKPADVAVYPSSVPYGGRTLETGCTSVYVFTPPRKTLLDHALAQRESRD